MNIQFIKKHISNKAKLILLLGAEQRFENEENPAFINSHEVFKVNNKLIRDLSQHDTMIDYISYQDNFKNGDGFYMNSYHFQPQVYYNVANKICEIVSSDGIIVGCADKGDIRLSELRNAIRHNFIINKIVEVIRPFIIKK